VDKEDAVPNAMAASNRKQRQLTWKNCTFKKDDHGCGVSLEPVGRGKYLPNHIIDLRIK
jgi:hypothetical protein